MLFGFLWRFRPVRDDFVHVDQGDVLQAKRLARVLVH